MEAMVSIKTGWTITALCLAFGACGGEQPQPQPQPQPTAEPAPDPEPAPPPADGGTSGQGGGQAAVSVPDKPKPSDRPTIMMGPSKEISTTFGSTPGAVLKLKGAGGTITLKIPEFALFMGTNVTWRIEAGHHGKSKGPVVGSVAFLETMLEGKKKPEAIPSRGPAYEFRWPTGGKDTINLAVGVRAIDSGGNPGKVSEWKIYPPKSVDTGFKEAYFYLTEIGPAAYLHATTAPATVGAEAEAQ